MIKKVFKISDNVVNGIFSYFVIYKKFAFVTFGFDCCFLIRIKGCHGRMMVGFTPAYLCMQSVSIPTNVVSSNPVHSEVYSIQNYVIKFVSDLKQVGRFLRVLLFPPSIKVIATRGDLEGAVRGVPPPP